MSSENLSWIKFPTCLAGDAALQLLPAEQLGHYFRMVLIATNANADGRAVFGPTGKPLTDAMLGRLLGIPVGKVGQVVAGLEEAGVIRRGEDGALIIEWVGNSLRHAAELQERNQRNSALGVEARRGQRSGQPHGQPHGQPGGSSSGLPPCQPERERERNKEKKTATETDTGANAPSAAAADFASQIGNTAEADSVEGAINPTLHQALTLAGIGEPTATKLAKSPLLTPDDVRNTKRQQPDAGPGRIVNALRATIEQRQQGVKSKTPLEDYIAKAHEIYRLALTEEPDGKADEIFREATYQKFEASEWARYVIPPDCKDDAFAQGQDASGLPKEHRHRHALAQTVQGMMRSRIKHPLPGKASQQPAVNAIPQQQFTKVGIDKR